MLDPGDCGGEPLLAALAPGARRPSNSRQQSQKEEVLRSRRAPRFAAISGPRAAEAAAAAAPRSPRFLLFRAPQPVPRCKLASRGDRRSSSPARAAPLAGGETRGYLPPAAGERGRRARGSQYIPGRGMGGYRSPSPRRRHPLRTPDPHTSAK